MLLPVTYGNGWSSVAGSGTTAGRCQVAAQLATPPSAAIVSTAWRRPPSGSPTSRHGALPKTEATVPA